MEEETKKRISLKKKNFTTKINSNFKIDEFKHFPLYNSKIYASLTNKNQKMESNIFICEGIGKKDDQEFEKIYKQEIQLGSKYLLIRESFIDPDKLFKTTDNLFQNLVHCELVNCRLTTLDFLISLSNHSNLEYLIFSENSLGPEHLVKSLEVLPPNLLLLDLSFQKTTNSIWKKGKASLFEKLKHFYRMRYDSEKKHFDKILKINLNGNGIKIEQNLHMVASFSLWEMMKKTDEIFKYLKIKTKIVIEENFDETDSILQKSYEIKKFREINKIFGGNTFSNMLIIIPSTKIIENYWLKKYSLVIRTNKDIVKPRYNMIDTSNLKIYSPFSLNARNENVYFADEKMTSLSLENQMQSLYEFFEDCGCLVTNHKDSKTMIVWTLYKTKSKISDFGMAELSITYNANIINMAFILSNDYFLLKSERRNRLAISNMDALIKIFSYLNEKHLEYKFLISPDGYNEQNEVKIRCDILYLKGINITKQILYSIDEGLKILKIFEMEDIYQKDYDNTRNLEDSINELYKKIKNKIEKFKTKSLLINNLQEDISFGIQKILEIMYKWFCS